MRSQKKLMTFSSIKYDVEDNLCEEQGFYICTVGVMEPDGVIPIYISHCFRILVFPPNKEILTSLSVLSYMCPWFRVSSTLRLALGA